MTTRLVILSCGRQEVAQPDHLLDDLALGQVPLDPFQSTGAENTSHPTADLGADADGPAVLLGHQHTLDPSAVATSQQQLVGSVGGLPLLYDLGAEDRPLRVELLAQAPGQVGHPLEPLGAVLEDPAKHLVRVETRVADLFDPGLQLVGRRIK